MRLSLTTIVICLAGTFVAGCTSAMTESVGRFSRFSAEARIAEGSFQETITVPSSLTLDVSNRSGSITVRRGRSNQVSITGMITVGRRRNGDNADEFVRRIEVSPPIDLLGNVLRVGSLRGRGAWNTVSISYEIEVPSDTVVRSQTRSGRQDISGITSRFEASTGSGQINLRDLRGTVDGSTGNGLIVG